ncbi:acyltransferase [Parendozoicomonas sp. Alg238-R29]|uniref:acyltransferase n=1 Tax=Parendozoicomonas sp. Alg238-R29 TaxID=2993446 RepID=UPI00248ED819|nr:acyltransferase [Parendozoicomonas sp. Alg238-R29]
MLSFLPPLLRGVIASLLLALNTILTSVVLFSLALIKALVPVKPFQTLCSKGLDQLVSFWISINHSILHLCSPMKLEASGFESLSLDRSYLVTSNHQSWADIVLAQVLLNRRAPQLKFFLKKELIWVPILGLCWWALDFPFMQRHTKAYLKKHPEKKGQDLETTRKACEKFKDRPVCIYNFLEGTRFSETKHKRQNSPYNHLLKPKSGGVGFVIGAMGHNMPYLLNITIQYEGKVPDFWDFLCGRCPAAKVHMETIDIPKDFVGKNYMEDREFRAEMQCWVNNIWEEKDKKLEEMH